VPDIRDKSRDARTNITTKVLSAVREWQDKKYTGRLTFRIDFRDGGTGSMKILTEKEGRL